VASVHNLTENVSEIIPWDITRLEFVDILVQDNGRISEVTQREIVTKIPSFLSESLSLDNTGMEVAQGEENTLKFDVLVVELIHIWEEAPSSLHVGSETTRWLVTELDGFVQDTNWNLFGWFGRQEQTEVGVTSTDGLRDFLKLLLEVSQEVRHKMDILEHQPKTLFEGLIQFGNSLLFHLGTQRNLEVLFISLDESHLFTEVQHVLSWIGTLGQDEEDWDGWIIGDSVESVLKNE
jgi:hypothetical protein